MQTATTNSMTRGNSNDFTNTTKRKLNLSYLSSCHTTFVHYYDHLHPRPPPNKVIITTTNARLLCCSNQQLSQRTRGTGYEQKVMYMRKPFSMASFHAALQPYLAFKLEKFLVPVVFNDCSQELQHMTTNNIYRAHLIVKLVGSHCVDGLYYAFTECEIHRWI